MHLDAEQFQRVHRYALTNTNGDLDRATQDLLNFVIRSWLPEPARGE